TTLSSSLFPYTTLFRSHLGSFLMRRVQRIYPAFMCVFAVYVALSYLSSDATRISPGAPGYWSYLLANFLLLPGLFPIRPLIAVRSEEHTSELQSRFDLV